MKIFVDSADLAEIKSLNSVGIIDGVTTNPSLISRCADGSSYKKVLSEICKEVDGPVSAEVISTDTDSMVQEGLELAKLADNIVIKVPATIEGIKACRILSQSNKSVNVTLCFSLSQALLAAKANATYISPFVGRMEDNGLSGMELVQSICRAYSNYTDIKTQVLVASIRELAHLEGAAVMGADVVTVPPKIIRSMAQNELTALGLQRFLQDWNQPIN